MILIAESGSTKTDWVAFSSNNEPDINIKTAGFNPHILSSLKISEQLFQSKDLKVIASRIKEIHFYGAGCSSLPMKKVVKEALRSLFPTARINVYHDLEAAVRSTWKGEPAITSILGTGSNCCLYNGESICQNKPSLGYLLGDEGSGNNIGGKLYRSIVYGNAPKEIENDFLKQYNFDKTNLVNLLYSKQKPNEFLASFMPFVKERRNHPFIKEIITNAFQSFVDEHIKSFENYNNIECHFIGSLAYYFEEELNEVLVKEDIKMCSVTKSPLLGLLKYHKKLSA